PPSSSRPRRPPPRSAPVPLQTGSASPASRRAAAAEGAATTAKAPSAESAAKSTASMSAAHQNERQRCSRCVCRAPAAAPAASSAPAYQPGDEEPDDEEQNRPAEADAVMPFNRPPVRHLLNRRGISAQHLRDVLRAAQNAAREVSRPEARQDRLVDDDAGERTGQPPFRAIAYLDAHPPLVWGVHTP